VSRSRLERRIDALNLRRLARASPLRVTDPRAEGAGGVVGMACYAVPVAERSVRRRNEGAKRTRTSVFRSARWNAGGDIAARCPYLWKTGKS
jgi:hypothetical protein